MSQQNDISVFKRLCTLISYKTAFVILSLSAVYTHNSTEPENMSWYSTTGCAWHWQTARASSDCNSFCPRRLFNLRCLFMLPFGIEKFRQYKESISSMKMHKQRIIFFRHKKLRLELPSTATTTAHTPSEKMLLIPSTFLLCTMK